MTADGNEAALVDKSLAQQMRITDFEVELRKQLFEITQDDADTLNTFSTLIAEKIQDIVDEFYAGQRQVPEISLLIGDAETFRRLQSSMCGYILDLFSGIYDSEYVNRRLRIGKVHKRIGVSPKLYIFSMSALERILSRYLQDSLAKADDCCRCNDSREALRKLLAFDLHLVMETYIRSMVDEVEAAHKEMARYAESLETIVAERTRQLQGLSRRDELTGIGNQRAFHEDLRRELAVATRQGTCLTLVYFDLNKFKVLNDNKGHQAGDAILRCVGQCMTKTARETDHCYRYGGDEFAVMLLDTDLKAGRIFCNRLIAAFDEKETEGVSFSMGLIQAGPVFYPDNDFILKKADASMYRAKDKSRATQTHVVDAGEILED